MSILNNIQKKDNYITFDIKNKDDLIYTSLVNSIRRTILSDIETWCINPLETTFFDNSSVLNNEFISHRLSLVPIRCDIKNIDYDSIIIECKKKNEEEEIIGVYVNDFIVTDKNSGEQIDINVFFPYPDILIANLKYNQNIYFECKIIKKSVANGGTSAHCPVCTCVHTFAFDESRYEVDTKDMSEEEKKNYFKERSFQKNKYHQPVLYNMTVESIGQYEQTEIVLMGIQALKNRINKFIDDIKKRNDRIEIHLDDIYGDIHEIIVHNETDTLGNVFTQYYGLNENVEYSGYVVRHPLRKEILMKFKLKNNNTLENVINLMDDAKNKIFVLLDQIYSDLSK